MPDYKRIELLVKVAKLYYENDYSQEMIAKKLGLSRPYISKLLNESKWYCQGSGNRPLKHRNSSGEKSS